MLFYVHKNHNTALPMLSHVTKASSLKDRMIGLLRHKYLDADHALWIVPCNSIQTFFMRFSIDVVFLNKHNTIVRLYKNLKPFRLTRIVSNAHSVLEMSQGCIDKHQLNLGDQLLFVEKSL
ncbi:MAG TPA: DUF192 domain-containing protein [Oligoflexia bacterium]|nr:DUF192 domain-containing protein [Oligoflexia bacterium]HMR25514.1 DUF192 domain-containing protein [Oligoflexia bacterium]